MKRMHAFTPDLKKINLTIFRNNIFVVFICLLAAAGSAGCKKEMPSGKQEPERRWIVSTIAGNGDASFADGATATAKFHFPNDVAVASDGSLFVSDGDNLLIRKIAGGQVSSFAGGTFGIVDGIGASAQFKFPTSLAFDDRGNIFSADARDPRIRKTNPGAVVTTFAGSADEGFADGAGASAKFRGENTIATDETGVVYISDAQNNRIRKIIEPGLVSTIAGSDGPGLRDGQANKAAFDFPDGIAVDKHGNIFVSDGSNFCIRKITPDGMVSTLAGKKQQGHSDGDGTTALFEFPGDMVIDQQDNLYVIDLSTIRKISPMGIVSTIAGSTDGFQDGEGTVAKFFTPYGLGIDAQGNIYVADTNNNRIRKINIE